MTIENIYERLTKILQDVFDEDDVVARPELTADEVEGWDSFAHLRLIIAVEREFGVAFSAAEVDSLANVGELAELVRLKTSSPSS